MKRAMSLRIERSMKIGYFVHKPEQQTIFIERYHRPEKEKYHERIRGYMMRDHYCTKSEEGSQSQTSMTTKRPIDAAGHSKQDEHGERESERLIREIRIEEQEVWVSHIQQCSNPGHPRRTGDVF